MLITQQVVVVALLLIVVAKDWYVIYRLKMEYRPLVMILQLEMVLPSQVTQETMVMLMVSLQVPFKFNPMHS